MTNDNPPDRVPIQAPPSALAAAIVPAVFQQAVEQADIAISITDADANILYVNPAFTRVTGYTAEEIVGANHSLLSNKSTPETIYQAMWAAIGAGQAWSGRLVNRRKDGGKYLADVVITPVVDGEGRITNFLGIQRDVTDLHRLECEVGEQKALIESVVDSAPVILALLDNDFRVVLDNHEYKKLVSDLRAVEPATVILDAVRTNLGTSPGTSLGPPRVGRYAFHDHEIRFDSRNGTRWYSCSGLWVQRKDGKVERFFDRQDETFLLLVAKETTRQRAEQEKTRLAMLQAMMSEENRIDGLRETLSAAVFKIEGPVNIMASVLATLERRGGSPAGSALAGALHAGRDAIDSLRSAIPEHSPESRTAVNINEVMRDVLDLTTTRMLAAGITVHWQPQSVLPSLNAYPNRMRMMFKAIVDNAIEAMNAKGWKDRELSVVTRGHADRVEVVIEDTGPGIPPNLRYKVFEPFFSTRQGGGKHLGTGLSSAQQVAADHDGVIEIDSTERRGCRVRVVLPAQRRG